MVGTASGELVNRYYSNAYGRFMTPDPYQETGGGPGDPDNPQSWNHYAYVLGDPVNWLDPQGLFQECPACPIYNSDSTTVVQTLSSNAPIPYLNVSVTTLIAQAVQVAATAAASQFSQMFGTNYCGIGGSGPTVNKLDEACKAHDECYAKYGFTWISDFDPTFIFSPSQLKALQECNQQLCDSALHSGVKAGLAIYAYFSAVPTGSCVPFHRRPPRGRTPPSSSRSRGTSADSTDTDSDRP